MPTPLYMTRRLQFLRETWPEAFSSDFPYSPTRTGSLWRKGRSFAVSSLPFQQQVHLLPRFQQHILCRVSGAQFLTRLGYTLEAVQLIGRWGSDAVKRYVQESA